MKSRRCKITKTGILMHLFRVNVWLCLTSNFAIRTKVFPKITVQMTKYFLHECHLKWLYTCVLECSISIWNRKFQLFDFEIFGHIFLCFCIVTAMTVTLTPCQRKKLIQNWAAIIESNAKWFNRLASPKLMKVAGDVNKNNHLIMINELSLKVGSFEHY